jgi:histidinol-phosphate aminotransferase
MIPRADVAAFLERVPGHVLTVIDEAYFEYVDDPEYGDGISEHVKAGRNVIVLRTFSKIYGLAGLRVGYGVGPREVVDAIKKVRNPFDITQPAQEAALASLGDTAELDRRRRLNAESRSHLLALCRDLPVEVAEPAVANFLYARVGGDARTLFDALLHEGVIVRPLGPFGAPDAIRVTVGTTEESDLFADAFRRVSALAAGG